YRLKDPDVYAEWYGTAHRHPQILPNTVYGLPELYREKITRALLTANPGCYPTSVILPLCPALENELIDTDGIVADSKSGATGAGRKEALATHFCEVSDSFRAYNLGKHRHTPEIEQELSFVAGRDLRVSFNTHLLPMNRGILSTIYTHLKKNHSLDAVHSLYLKWFENEPWVRVLPKGTLPETRWVRGTMFCDVGIAVDSRTNRLILVSAVDNLCRGASGQALANANLMCGLPMTFGLDTAPLMP
ncbi:MAG: N-acetyl-gamma-glutamyl-phosphate reductase, partial [Thermodesulfobacteriota bacterium]|nr:N-acetyl-gamma-glutamyl-phosphate reductase [Thermodesulfobacteriota bacterium]